jgi:pantoate--beta-alanine ligase
MLIISSNSELQNKVQEFKSQGRKIGFVPTMGALHQGHLSLVKEAKTKTDIVVVSIFVNPTQFGPKEDLEKYPRQIEKDCELLKSVGADLVFNPTTKEIYPEGTDYSTEISVPKLSQLYCGKTRPNHFKGVCSVVLRFFDLVKPDMAFFGKKDFQQLAIIKKMTKDLFLPIEIVGCEIIREESGLAMSSRNVYLSEEERVEASAIYRALLKVKQMVKEGIKDTDKLKRAFRRYLKHHTNIKVDYVVIVDEASLLEVQEIKAETRILFAGYVVGKMRLIDNMGL